MYICPNDLMLLDKDGSLGYGEMKAFNRDPSMCWECYNCVKICPSRQSTCAVTLTSCRWAPRWCRCAVLTDIMWTVKFRDGSVKRFKFPIRTTAEGSAGPWAALMLDGDRARQLMTEPASARGQDARIPKSGLGVV
jgi:adenylylsulfate reductase subunit B